MKININNADFNAAHFRHKQDNHKKGGKIYKSSHKAIKSLKTYSGGIKNLNGKKLKEIYYFIAYDVNKNYHKYLQNPKLLNVIGFKEQKKYKDETLEKIELQEFRDELFEDGYQSNNITKSNRKRAKTKQTKNNGNELVKLGNQSYNQIVLSLIDDSKKRESQFAKLPPTDLDRGLKQFELYCFKHNINLNKKETNNFSFQVLSPPRKNNSSKRIIPPPVVIASVIQKKCNSYTSFKR